MDLLQQYLQRSRELHANVTKATQADAGTMSKTSSAKKKIDVSARNKAASELGLSLVHLGTRGFEKVAMTEEYPQGGQEYAGLPGPEIARNGTSVTEYKPDLPDAGGPAPIEVPGADDTVGPVPTTSGMPDVQVSEGEVGRALVDKTSARNMLRRILNGKSIHPYHAKESAAYLGINSPTDAVIILRNTAHKYSGVGASTADFINRLELWVPDMADLYSKVSNQNQIDTAVRAIHDIVRADQVLPTSSEVVQAAGVDPAAANAGLQLTAELIAAVGGQVQTPDMAVTGMAPPMPAVGGMPAEAPMPMPAQPPVQAAPMGGAPMQGAPMEGAPMEGAPMEGAPMQGAPMEGAPMQGAPAQGAPAPTPGEGAPMEVTSAYLSDADIANFLLGIKTSDLIEQPYTTSSDSVTTEPVESGEEFEHMAPKPSTDLAVATTSNSTDIPQELVRAHAESGSAIDSGLESPEPDTGDLDGEGAEVAGVGEGDLPPSLSASFQKESGVTEKDRILASLRSL